MVKKIANRKFLLIFSFWSLVAVCNMPARSAFAQDIGSYSSVQYESTPDAGSNAQDEKNQESRKEDKKTEEDHWNSLVGPMARDKFCSNIFKKIWNWKYCFSA